MVGLREVAAQAGVSVATASQVINDVPGKRIAEQTRHRVLVAARELEYRPNGLARALRSQRSCTLGFVSDMVATSPFAVGMIAGAQDAAAAADNLLFVVSYGTDRELERRQLDALLGRQIDGVLYASMYHRIVDPPVELGRVPAVLVDGRSPGSALSSVVPDEKGGARSVVGELLAFGHRRIGFLHHDEQIPATDLRMAGYAEALGSYGLAVDPALILHGHDAPGGYETALRLLSRQDRPTALFCFTDRMAMGAYQAAQALGLSVPDDVSIVGFDDQQNVAEALRPGLTTVRLPHYEMGYWGAEQLLAQIGGRAAVVDHEIECPLIRRGSVATPKPVR